MTINRSRVYRQPPLDRQALRLLRKLFKQHLNDFQFSIVTSYVQRRVFGDGMNRAVRTAVEKQFDHVALSSLTRDEQQRVRSVRCHVYDVLQVGLCLTLDNGSGGRTVALHAGHSQCRMSVQLCFLEPKEKY